MNWPKMWVPPRKPPVTRAGLPPQPAQQQTPTNPFALKTHFTPPTTTPSAIPTLFDPTNPPTYDDAVLGPPPGFSVVALAMREEAPGGAVIGPVEAHGVSETAPPPLSLYALSKSLLDPKTRFVEVRRQYHKAAALESGDGDTMQRQQGTSNVDEKVVAEQQQQQQQRPSPRIKTTALPVFQLVRVRSRLGARDSYKMKPLLESLGYLRTLHVELKSGLGVGGRGEWEFCVDVKLKKAAVGLSTGSVWGDVKEVVKVKNKAVLDLYRLYFEDKCVLRARRRKDRGSRGERVSGESVGWEWEWIDEQGEVIAGEVEAEGKTPVLMVVKELEKGAMDLLVSAWSVKVWDEIHRD